MDLEALSQSAGLFGTAAAPAKLGASAVQAFFGAHAKDLVAELLHNCTRWSSSLEAGAKTAAQASA
jgi:hypothetical protein